MYKVTVEFRTWNLDDDSDAYPTRNRLDDHRVDYTYSKNVEHAGTAIELLEDLRDTVNEFFADHAEAELTALEDYFASLDEDDDED